MISQASQSTSQPMSRSYPDCFPEKSDRQTVDDLQKLVKALTKEIATAQKKMRFPTLKLSPEKRTVLAEILVDFLLDIRSGSGIWTALETCNRRTFGTPLPIILPTDVPLPDGFRAERLHFLLWIVYDQLDPGRVTSPKHADLLVAVSELAPRLERILPKLPKRSPVKAFLDKPNDYGWEVKRKLIWLGTKSYLFRLLFDEYIESEHGGETDIPQIDDFVCQEATSWSGFVATDILAECLDLAQEQKDELRSWALRHLSIYKITKTHKETFEAVNLVNDAPYLIRQAAPSNPGMGPFRTGSVVYGSLVPWRGEWYWSGKQYDLTPYPLDAIKETLRKLKLNTNIVCRYWRERETAVREAFKDHCDAMIAHYGGDFRLLPSGRVWEKEEVKRIAAAMKNAGHQGRMPNMSFPENLLKNRNGVAVFVNPEEGMEIMEEFNPIRDGLKKNGRDVLPEEENMIRIWMQSTSISPAFVRRALKKYGGGESIKFAFRCETDAQYALEYLLRCNKGHYYRPRFPALGITENDD